MIINRHKLQLITDRLNQFPAVALLGPRQVGKTTLAQIVARKHDSIYLDLEKTSDRVLLSDAEYFLTSHEDKLVIIDEIHRTPELFQTLRGLIDSGRRRGIRTKRFLLLGSASIELIRQSGESLAGRIAYVSKDPPLTRALRAELQSGWFPLPRRPRTFMLLPAPRAARTSLRIGIQGFSPITLTTATSGATSA